MSNKELVINALGDLFTKQDADAIDRYFAPDYRQHSALNVDGGLRGVIAEPPPGFGYELVRVLEDGDLVATHGVYTGLTPEPLAAFDLFRVSGGRIVEHWDAHMPQREPNPAGRTLTDGPTEVRHPEQTEATRALAQAFLEAAFINADFAAAREFLSPTEYLQHNPAVGDGVEAFAEAMAGFAESGITIAFHSIRELVAEGEFALMISDAEIGGPAAVWDLVRVDGDRIVEHWDIVQPTPDGNYF